MTKTKAAKKNSLPPGKCKSVPATDVLFCAKQTSAGESAAPGTLLYSPIKTHNLLRTLIDGEEQSRANARRSSPFANLISSVRVASAPSP
ncbi:MAG: hypothetical protein A3E07_00755 [Candidatus Wildermuthbacteria bacterium RIFCSPHIGHO2_12_FULL_45_9]|nr:MAG: hypothetical protein A3E07_00755 [Candidatus Wildermuthbacteria bacterium RIFCSPHIGHO2_12_FULL_45_9]